MNKNNVEELQRLMEEAKQELFEAAERQLMEAALRWRNSPSFQALKRLAKQPISRRGVLENLDLDPPLSEEIVRMRREEG